MYVFVPFRCTHHQPFQRLYSFPVRLCPSWVPSWSSRQPKFHPMLVPSTYRFVLVCRLVKVVDKEHGMGEVCQAETEVDLDNSRWTITAAVASIPDHRHPLEWWCPTSPLRQLSEQLHIETFLLIKPSILLVHVFVLYKLPYRSRSIWCSSVGVNNWVRSRQRYES